ncbi:hypothetical protein BVRB_035990 [Beta vulgaris subsp. vulgaris]|uniref:Uncharacterized protein n=1 Tax=Beta vulgaris subsp. vulgaris TaxID=3555 RepID=A0A0J7YQM9_BETVV|nr:hypothetical protein BVRB_035990 [Beta vulgaris subsp. vulgaris]
MSLVVKRPSEAHGPDTALIKRQKTDNELGTVLQPARTSSLPAPTMLLTGHGAAVNVNRFNGDGSVLASGSFDKQICTVNIIAMACLYLDSELNFV